MIVDSGGDDAVTDMTVGQLRSLLAGVSDEVPVYCGFGPTGFREEDRWPRYDEKPATDFYMVMTSPNIEAGRTVPRFLLICDDRVWER